MSLNDIRSVICSEISFKIYCFGFTNNTFSMGSILFTKKN